MDYLKDFEISVKDSKKEKGYSKAQQNREFLENLKSYSSKGWWHMPAILYPNMCSLYGWKCGKGECLTCRKCGASLLLRPPTTDSEKDLIEVTKCFESLSTKHESTCTYKESPMPHNLLYMPLVSPEECLQEVINDYREGKHQIISTIFSPNFEDRMEEYDSLISWIVEKSGQSDASRNDRKAMLIILSGWKIRKKSQVECEQCFRSLGLWNYSSDVEPEPKRLSSEEWDKQKEEFIKEYSRVGTTEEYPAQGAERYEKEDDRIEKANGSLKKNPRVELKVPEGSETDIVSGVGTIEEYPVPDAEWYVKEEDQVLKSNGSTKETPRVELEAPEGSNEDVVNIVGTAKEYPAQDGERYGEEDEQVRKFDGSMKETSKVELEVSEESEKDDVRRIGTARACPAEDAERYEKEDNQVEKLNASIKETARVEMEAPYNDNASAQAAESQRPQNIDKLLDVNLLEEKPKLESQTRKDSDSPMNKKKKTEEKPTLDPLAEHFPWCRWVFVGFGNVTEDVSPSWLQRIEVLTQLMIQDKIRRKSKSHVFTPVLLDSALHPT